MEEFAGEWNPMTFKGHEVTGWQIFLRGFHTPQRRQHCS